MFSQSDGNVVDFGSAMGGHVGSNYTTDDPDCGFPGMPSVSPGEYRYTTLSEALADTFPSHIPAWAKDA